MLFSPSRAVLSAILRDEYLPSAVRTKERDKAGSNQPPARDPIYAGTDAKLFNLLPRKYRLPIH